MSETGHTERLEAALDGKYRIERKLGEGGMASVYLAEDIKHERRVALKILRPELAAVIGAERFLSEIKTTANLQHPHILPLFDSGEAGGYLYYVMPYIEGETLREKLDREKQLGVEEAVRIARDVADALDYAHRAGVIHRDIKPGNILLHDGRPVVADFGIALAVSAAGGGRMTETGLSLGTPHYMSPEQASADRDLSARSDVYSLGCVLYEMIGGQPPHTGPSAQSILVHILTKEATPLTELRHTVPPNVASTVAKAIEKLPADRFESSKQFMKALDDEGFTYQARQGAPATAAIASPEGVAASLDTRPLWHRDGRVVAALAVSAIMTTLAAWALLRPSPPPPARVAMSAQVTGLVMDVGGDFNQLAISPDGRWIVAGGRSEGGERMLFLRGSADPFEWRSLPNTEDGRDPTFSPDGEWVAFGRPGGISKVPILGGPALPVSEPGEHPHWGANDMIVFDLSDALYVAPGSGGEAEPLFDVDSEYEVEHPHMLPDGSGVLYSTDTGGDPLNARIVLYDIESERFTELVASGNRPMYVSTGHIVYGHGGQALMAVDFDLETREVGSPTTLIPQLTVYSNGAVAYDVSATGTLIYNATPGLGGGGGLSFVEVELDGTATPLDLGPGTFFTPRYSPDGSKIAYEDAGEIHVYDVATGASPRFTEAGGRTPVWSPGGEYLYFTSDRQGTASFDGFRRRVDQSEPAEHLYSRPGTNYVRAVWAGDSGDSILIVRDILPSGDRNLLVMHLGPGGSVPDSASFENYLTAEWNELQAEISPDGRYVAYASEQTGDFEVYLQSFPTATGRRSISQGGGNDPQWVPNENAIYYRAGTSFYAIDVTTDPFTVGVPRLLFDYPQFREPNTHPTHWDVHPDGTRFILIEARGTRGASAGSPEVGEETLTPSQRLEDVYIVVDWFTELRRLMGVR